MQKALVTFVCSVLLVAVVVGCSGKKSEKEYYDMAYQAMAKEKWSEAEANFQKILDEYPEGPFASKAMFMIGFINANYLKNFDKAKQYYGDFLKKYPKHELADDAQYEIQNLGKSVDELPFMQEGSAGADSSSKAS
ncbi:MAG: hypothetical protein Kow0037_27300 [Calditrichia bacterium]